MSSIGPVPSGAAYVPTKPAAPPAQPPQQQPVTPTTDADGDHDGSTMVNEKA